MNKIYLYFVVILAISSLSQAQSDFLSEEDPRDLFTFGNSIGLSSSLRCTADSTCFNASSLYNLTSCCG